ncbi:MAG: DUF5674 family protein [Acidobacteriota bacterium]|nr:DUF5674 family protein [Acidobacteriota bacterium]
MTKAFFPVALKPVILYNSCFKCETVKSNESSSDHYKSYAGTNERNDAVARNYIKLAVDVEQEILAGGGALHADCEAILLDSGSIQENIWGADWVPFTHEVTFEIILQAKLYSESVIQKSGLLDKK